jgi:hypothetical protein
LILHDNGQVDYAHGLLASPVATTDGAGCTGPASLEEYPKLRPPPDKIWYGG